MPPQPLWNRNFVLWLLGNGQAQFGNALGSLALSFLVLRQTGQAGQMALTFALAMLPNLLMPLAGAWVDRVGLRWPLVGASLVQGVLQTAVGGLALTHLSGGVPLWFVNAAAFAGGLAAVLAAPASQAALPALVPAEELPRAAGLLGSVTQGARLLGTLAGGAVVAALSPGAALLADALGFFIWAALLPFIALPTPAEKAGAPPTLWQDLRGGLRLMQQSRVLTALPLLALVSNACVAPVLVVTPKLMDSLGQGPRGYGHFLALEGLGTLLVGGLFAVFGKRLPLRWVTLLGLALGASAQLGMWAAPQYLPLLACSLAFGVALGLTNLPLGTLIQQHVPQAFLGRVFAVLSTVGSLGMPLTLLAVSPLLDRLALPSWYALSAAGLLSGALLWGWLLWAEAQMPVLQTPDVN